MEFLVTMVLALLGGALVYSLALRSMQLKMHGKPRWQLTQRAADWVFAALVLAYTVVLCALSILQHLSFNTGGFDLGVFDQAVWNSLNGRLLATTIVPDISTLLGQHFSPILLAFVPLYTVWSSPIVLLIVQTLGLTFAALPLYWFARAHVGNALALVMVSAYFLSPTLQFVNLAQFHEIALAVPLLALATFFLWREQNAAFLICLFVALLVKEDIALVTMMFGFVILLRTRRWRLGLALVLLGALWITLLLQYLIPAWRGTESSGYYFFGSGVAAGQGRYDYLGNSFSQIALTIVTRPDIVLAHLAVPAKLEFVLQQLVPLAFVPLIGLEMAVLALPTFATSLLSDHPPQFSIRYHYAAPILPFLFFAAVLGVERLVRGRMARGVSEEHLAARRWAIGAMILVASGTSYFLYAPGPLTLGFEPGRYILNARTALGERLAQSIPADSVVVAQGELVSHLSDRRFVYEFPAIPDYRQTEYLFADTRRFWYDFHRGAWDVWRATGYFETITEQDGYLLARRRPVAHSLDYRYGDQMTLLGYTIVPMDALRGGSTLRPIVEWRAERNLRERYRMRVRLLDERGHLWGQDEREPANGFAPTDTWTANQRVGDQYSLALPPTMPPGDYRLTLSVFDPQTEESLVARDVSGELLGDAPMVASVRIEKNKASITASQLSIGQPLYVDMREIRFLGYIPPRERIRAGELLQIGLYWRAREKPRGDYVVAVQLRDASGRVAFEQVSRPANGAYPTTQWDTGEVLLDWHDFDLPRDLAIGEYKVFVVLREAGQVLGETGTAKVFLSP